MAKFIGWVDGARGGQVFGWACEQDSDRRLTVLIETAPGRLASTRADLFRSDVQRMGHSRTGYCGFSFPLAWLIDGWPARFLLDEPRGELGGGPILKSGAPAPRAKIRRSGAYVLALDPVRFGVRGWVRNRRDPTRRPLLRLEADGRLLGKCRATLHRADAEAATGDGFHGFAFAQPDRPGAYVLRDDETGVELARFSLKSEAAGDFR